MIQETDVRERLAAYLSDELPLDEFEDWLVAESWNMHLDSTPEVQELVSGIELELSEYSNNHLSDADLAAKLQSLLGEIAVSISLHVTHAPTAAPVQTGATLARVPPVSVLQLT